jgi:hypothetical protein
MFIHTMHIYQLEMPTTGMAAAHTWAAAQKTLAAGTGKDRG